MTFDIDLRKDPRISPLIIRAHYQCGEDVKEGYLLNLSRGGAFLATNELLPIEEVLKLRIELPWNLGEFNVDAKVVWRSDMHSPSSTECQEGLGLTFTDLTPRASEKLRNFLEKFAQLAAQIEDSA